MLSKSALTFAVAGLALGGSALAQEPGAAKPVPTVTVVGRATEDVRPDIAIADLRHPGRTPDRERRRERERAARDGGHRGPRGRPESRRRTSRRSASALTPVWNDERDAKTGQVVKRTLSGYQASNALSVRVRAIDKAGSIIEQASRTAPSTKASAFDLSDREAREDALRVKAVANALRRAALYARGRVDEAGRAAGASTPTWRRLSIASAAERRGPSTWRPRRRRCRSSPASSPCPKA